MCFNAINGSGPAYFSEFRLVHYALLLTLLNPIIFQSQTENHPLLTVFPPQLISIPSFCYSHCVCVRACVRACVCREVFLVQMFVVLEHNCSCEINSCIIQPVLKRPSVSIYSVVSIWRWLRGPQTKRDVLQTGGLASAHVDRRTWQVCQWRRDLGHFGACGKARISCPLLQN